MQLRLAAAFLALSFAVPAYADEIALRAGEPLARADLLKSGTQRYVRYLLKDGRRNPLDTWTRTITFEQLDGRPVVRIAQQWDGGGPTPTQRLEESVLEARTMRPLSQSRTLTSGGKTKSYAYLFGVSGVTGDPSVADNAAAGFSKPLSAPVYDFVPDIEWFRQLPMRAGRTFVADLYDPGSGEPGRYRFVVAGSARIAGPDGRPIDCWLVTTDYNHPERGLSRYWFAKSNQYLVRQEADAGEHGRVVKLLLPAEADDQP